MAKVSSVHSDSESGDEKGPANKKNRTEEELMDVDNEDEDENGEEEYEIEAIIDAKRGSFPEGRMGYLVKWKGYDESENSWVDENAHALIEEYWRKHPRKGGRKSMDSKTPKKPRKSAAPEEPSESVSTATKKRGRKSQADMDAAAASENRAKKKAKKNGAPAKSISDDESHPFEEEVIVGNMSKYMHKDSWEDVVDKIDTIERSPDGDLRVYFTLTTGERVEEKSRLCAQRFPQKLISFYEDNLRWKSAGGDEDES
ncbi:hypothetical protein H0H87_001541 [Tephrocybe sp. NHM501043]|nr:hypothetical protein H0H87_001541 [Tephrocybe sp. NHM501043]